ncbi:hypothetical protein [Agromyces sp. LHK192]|uniref:hypothetical protein n=1 Tax=Agromyces sp. LHK192 TaxID=2498704 RepID=UPI000FDB3579|nr:hypothetical protein [Agromyces sp. LHK192]
MVAQFLRLRLQLLGNGFRRSTWHVVGIVLGLVYGLGLAIALFAVLVGLRGFDDVELLRDAITVAGALTLGGFILLPLIFGSDDALDPRRFALFGIPDRTLALGLGLAALVGVPALVLAIVLTGTIVTWSRGFGETLLAVVCAPIALATCILIARVTTGIASLVLTSRRAKEFMGVLGVLLLVAIAPVLVLLVTMDWSEFGVPLLESAGGFLGWTPLGAVFAAPGDAAAGAWGAALLKLLIAAGTAGLIWLGWQRLVAHMLVTPGRQPSTRSYRGLGWFDLLPHTGAGTVAARTFTYWFRDPRYWVAFIIIPVVPVLVLVPLAIAGVPASYLPLIPVPLMALFLGWSVHNDVAYDSTAVWLHVASGVRGAADRFGRLVPVLVAGIVVIGLGSAVTVLVLDDWRMLPSVLGVSTALLLAGLGIGSIMSARFPYPVVKPGDSPFQQPQSTGASGALVQTAVMLGALLVAAPAIWFGGLGIVVDPEWHVISLFAGVGAGLVVFVAGIFVGGRIFVRRGPEILQAAIRA